MPSIFQIFVFPNDFAPSGVNGILTIIRHVFGVNFGMLYMFINIPLLTAAFFVLRSTRKNSRIAPETGIYDF